MSLRARVGLSCSVAFRRLTMKEPTFRELGSAKFNVLIVWGKNDEICPVENGRRMHQLMSRNSTMVEVDKSGHLTVLEKTSEFNEALLRFLNERVADSGATVIVSAATPAVESVVAAAAAAPLVEAAAAAGADPSSETQAAAVVAEVAVGEEAPKKQEEARTEAPVAASAPDS